MPLSALALAKAPNFIDTIIIAVTSVDFSSFVVYEDILELSRRDVKNGLSISSFVSFPDAKNPYGFCAIVNIIENTIIVYR